MNGKEKENSVLNYLFYRNLRIFLFIKSLMSYFTNIKEKPAEETKKLLKIVEENLELQRKHLEKFDGLKGQFSPSNKRSYYENTTKLYFDKNDYSINLLLRKPPSI